MCEFSNRTTFVLLVIRTIAVSTNIMEMDIIILVSDFSYTKDIGKLPIKGGGKKGFIKILHPDLSSGLSRTVQPDL